MLITNSGMRIKSCSSRLCIDDYDDDELFVADLKSKYPNFTDNELLDKLDAAKINEDLYNKEVAELRALL